MSLASTSLVPLYIPSRYGAGVPTSWLEFRVRDRWRVKEWILPSDPLRKVLGEPLLIPDLLIDVEDPARRCGCSHHLTTDFSEFLSHQHIADVLLVEERSESLLAAHGVLVSKTVPRNGPSAQLVTHVLVINQVGQRVVVVACGEADAAR